MKLLWCVLHLGNSGMEVVAEDAQGLRRKVDLSWLVKENPDHPPPNWPSIIQGEMDYQDSEKVSPRIPIP
jgi:hypothetical protein